MKIGEIAEIVGTTTRAIRHYHRLGLLAEPKRLPNGYRDYSLGDVVRLMRIRWLASNGVPLESVGAIMNDEQSIESAGNSDVASVLRALISSIDADQAALAQRRHQLRKMLDEAESGNRVSPLPAGLASAVADAIEGAPNSAIGSALALDRELVEALSSSPAAPADLVAGFELVMASEAQRASYLTLIAQWSDLAGRDPQAVNAEIDELVAHLLEFFQRHQMTFIDPVTEAPTSNEQSVQSLEDLIPDAAQHEVARRLQRELLNRPFTNPDSAHCGPE